MLNHALVSTLDHEPRRASLGAVLSPSEAGTQQGTLDKESGQPLDLNYGAAHFSAPADATAAQRAYDIAYKAASVTNKSWILWLGLLMVSGITLFAYAFKKGEKDTGETSLPVSDREATLPPEPSVYGTSTGTAYGVW